jgi:hypothetical protein
LSTPPFNEPEVAPYSFVSKAPHPRALVHRTKVAKNGATHCHRGRSVQPGAGVLSQPGLITGISEGRPHSSDMPFVPFWWLCDTFLPMSYQDDLDRMLEAWDLAFSIRAGDPLGEATRQAVNLGIPKDKAPALTTVEVSPSPTVMGGFPSQARSAV